MINCTEQVDNQLLSKRNYSEVTEQESIELNRNLLNECDYLLTTFKEQFLINKSECDKLISLIKNLKVDNPDSYAIIENNQNMLSESIEDTSNLEQCVSEYNNLFYDVKKESNIIHQKVKNNNILLEKPKIMWSLSSILDFIKLYKRYDYYNIYKDYLTKPCDLNIKNCNDFVSMAIPLYNRFIEEKNEINNSINEIQLKIKENYTLYMKQRYEISLLKDDLLNNSYSISDHETIYKIIQNNVQITMSLNNLSINNNQRILKAKSLAKNIPIQAKKINKLIDRIKLNKQSIMKYKNEQKDDKINNAHTCLKEKYNKIQKEIQYLETMHKFTYDLKSLVNMEIDSDEIINKSIT